MAKKGGAALVIGLGVLGLFAFGGGQTAKAAPPRTEEDDETTTAPGPEIGQMLPAPVAPADPASVVIERPMEGTREEVPVSPSLLEVAAPPAMPGPAPVLASATSPLTPAQPEQVPAPIVPAQDVVPPLNPEASPVIDGEEALAEAIEEDSPEDEPTTEQDAVVEQVEEVASDVDPLEPEPAPVPPQMPAEQPTAEVPVAPPAPPQTPLQVIENAQPYVAPNQVHIPASEIQLEESPPVGPEEPAESPEQETSIPQDTLDVLRVMLLDEKGPNWKRRVPELEAWQRSRGLVADQAFGVKTALAMAEETGLVPIVRFWPKGSYPEGPWLKDYRQKLRALSMNKGEPHSSQLVAAAAREEGQGFGRGQTPISQTIEI